MSIKRMTYVILVIALIVGLFATALPISSALAAASVIYVDNLAPSWTAPGGGGVYSAYIGPPDYPYVSPGTTALYDGREAGIIKAGLAVDPTSGSYEDEGLFGFIPNKTIDQFAAGPVTFDVKNQEGTNPVWMTIEIDTGVAGDRADNTTYQYVPTTNPASWHTVDGVAGQWQKWNNNQGDVTGNPLLSLSAVAAAHPGLNVVRAYLRLGMGNSYAGTGAGTIAWVDKVTLGEVTYDFVIARFWYVSPTGLDTNRGTQAYPFLTIQAAVAAAAPGDTINLTPGTYTTTGGFQINTPNLTIILKPGAVIQNNSPCFTVNASYTTIRSDTIGGGKCVPTGGSNGINVASGLTNIVIEGIEFDGTGQSTGDGINFAGTVTDLVIVDNWFHNLSSDGIHFNAQPAGTVQIQGNLFQNNTGNGIEAGSFTIPAEYNAWGDYDGSAVATGGDGASSGVDADPWTHVDLYLTSSGTPWADQVVSGSTITYTVYGNFQNVIAADFNLQYPANLSYVSSTPGSIFGVPVEGNPVVTHTPGTRTINFRAVKLGSPVPAGTGQAIYTVTFTAGATGATTLNLDELTDGFGMPGVGSSTTIYASALADTTVKVIALPTMTSTDIQGYYLTSEARTFQVNVTNPVGGGTFGTTLYYDFTIQSAVKADIASLICDFAPTTNLIDGFTETGGNLTGRVGFGAGGFPMAPNTSYLTTCTVNFNTAKSYPMVVKMVDSASTPPYTTLAELLPAPTAVVYTKPTITSANLVGPYPVGIPQAFSLVVTNPSDIPDPFELQFNFPDGTVLVYGGITYPCTGGVCTVPVTLSAGTNDLSFTVTFMAAYSGAITVTLYDSDWLPADRALASLTQTGIVAYTNYTVTGTVSMQGRTFRGGVPMTLTALVVPYGPFNATSTNVISNNISFTNVAVDSYRITTNQPRYLDVTAALNKQIAIAADHLSITPLVLMGGDANDSNDIGLSDASLIGANYGSTADIGADVNFSGKVDIFDLALVGGNYELTSALAYASWIP